MPSKNSLSLLSRDGCGVDEVRFVVIRGGVRVTIRKMSIFSISISVSVSIGGAYGVRLMGVDEHFPVGIQPGHVYGNRIYLG